MVGDCRKRTQQTHANGLQWASLGASRPIKELELKALRKRAHSAVVAVSFLPLTYVRAPLWNIRGIDDQALLRADQYYVYSTTER